MGSLPGKNNRRWHLRRQNDRVRTAVSLELAPENRMSDESEQLSESIWAETEPPDEAQASSLASASHRSWYQRFFSEDILGAIHRKSSAFHRIFRVFLGARAALGLVLLASLALSGIFGTKPAPLVSVIILAYTLQTLLVWSTHRPRGAWEMRGIGLARLKFRGWCWTIGTDIVCYLSLHYLGSGSALNHMPMLVLPVLMAGVLTRRLLAMCTAALVALGLLGLAWLSSLSDSDFSPLLLTQAGLAGSGFFILTVLAGELAGRLAREERAARGSLELARQQVQLNRLMIEEMQDGVLVVDRSFRVRAANPAARRLLAPSAMCSPPPFDLVGTASWTKLVHSVEQAFATGVWPEEGRDVELNFDSSGKRILQMRIRFAKPSTADSNEEFCVLLLEDVRSMQARNRQEKLAAMGRMSAGIAHEIRNPLSAIAQANALLSEDASTPSQRQLTSMVSQNVDRLKRIIEDVLEAAPSGPQDAPVIDIRELTARTCSEWAESAGIAMKGDSALQIDLPDEICQASFDVDHLRRVLVNLLDNAWRHSSQMSGAIKVRLSAWQGHQWELSVSSDGPPIPEDVEPHLFEPFFSTRSRGTGLGLYICRELCERYGATMNYRFQPARSDNLPGRNEFFLLIRQNAALAVSEPMPLRDRRSRHGP